jgi:SRSO17 transposase
MSCIPLAEITEDRIAGWRGDLEALVARIGPLFHRSEVRARAGRVLGGLLSQVDRKNGWQLAEAVGEHDPHGVQRLLSAAAWDADALRDELQRYVSSNLGTPEGILVADESGFPKKGEHSVGVARQYCGTLGKVENCQVAVFLSYASERGHALLDRALYLHQDWTDDRERLKAAGVPREVGFATKPELARRMLLHAIAAGIGHAWVVADSVYGDDGNLRANLEARHEAYLLGVSANHIIWEAGEGREARMIIAALPETAWTRLTAGMGSQGERLFDWCWMQLTPPDAHGAVRWLVGRRTLAEKSELAYFRGYGPAATTLAALALVNGARWSIEDCLGEAKGLTGLDQYEVRGWVPWHRHLTLAMLAHAFLAVTRAQCTTGAAQKGGAATSHAT